MVLSQCETDFNCSGTRICYNTSWTNYSSQCLCSTWYGFTGENCTSIDTPTGIYRFFSHVLLLLAESSLLIISSLQFWKLLKVDRNWSVTHTSQIQIVLASFFYLMGESFDFSILLNPQDFVYPVGGEKSSKYFVPVDILILLGDCFVYLALAGLPVLWREITNQIFRPQKAKLTFVKPLIIFEFGFCASVLFVLIFVSPEYAFLVAAPFVIVLILAYGIYGVALFRVLVTLASTQDSQKVKFMKSAQRVARMSIVIFLLGLLDIIFSLLDFYFAGYPVWLEYSLPNVIAWPLLFVHFTTYISIISAIICQVFLSITTNSMTNQKKAQLSSKDQQNQEDNQQVAGYQQSTVEGTSVHPGSIVLVTDIHSMKKKLKLKRNLRFPTRLKPIEDFSGIHDNSFSS